MSVGFDAERYCTELCNRQFLKGFVFHSPHYYDPTKKEVGDVLLWIRRIVIVFEIVARDSHKGTNIRNFVRRIGEKRDQLINDYKVYNDSLKKITMINEQVRLKN